jgi:outer membrane immunogenic protein
MKKLLLAAVGFAALIAGPAVAADQAVRVYKRARPVVVAAPVYNWTGFYVGLNAGAAIGHTSQDPTLSAPGCPQSPGGGVACPALIGFFSAPQGMNSTVFTGGGQAGVNYQLGRLVLGIEADIQYMPLRHSFAVNATIPGGAPCCFHTASSSGSINTDWLVTVRPRVGWAFDRLLIYGTGGLAITNQRDSLTDIDIVSNNVGAIGVFNATSSRDVGGVVGGGLEYAFSNSLSAKAEYLYLDFGNVTGQAGNVGRGAGAVPQGGLTGASVIVTSHLTANIVRFGLNYKFGNYYAPVAIR